MRNKAESKKGQSGQILLYTTIIVMLAALILVPLMEFAFTSHRSAQIREERTLELYASDAGIEDALYQIKTEKKGTDLASLGFGDTSAYNPGTPGMNDRTMDVSVQKVWLPEGDEVPTAFQTESPTTDTDKSSDLVVVGMLKTIQAAAASDDFNSGGWSGGTGWTGSWTNTGSAGIVSSTLGCGGSGYALGFADSEGYAERTANLLKYMKPQLKFSAKASSLEAGDTVDLNVKYGDSDWETPVTWGDGDETSGCEAFNLDLYDLYGWGGGNTSVPLQVAFDANLNSSLIASHDFQPPNNTWSGGSGWAGTWSISSSTYCAIATSGGFCNSYHMRLQRTGSAWRRVDLSTSGSPHLNFYFRTEGYDNTWSDHDYAYLDVSKDGGSHWITNVWTWSSGTRAYPSCGTLQDVDVDLTSYVAGSSQFVIRFRGNAESGEYFDVDNISISEGDSFYADNLWIGDEYNSNTIEIAYTDAADLPSAYLDRVGVWMPPGCHYVSVVGNETTDTLEQEPTILLNTYAGGTILEWDFSSPGVALHQPPGQLPIVKTLTFTYQVDVAQTVEGMFTWIKAHGSSDQTYISWDKGYEIYKATSQAHSEIYGTNTQVTAYVAQGEVNKKNAASYGDYVATGNPLLIDYTGSTYVKEKVINPSDPYTWVTKDLFLYDGRSDITSIASDATVTAAWLYWSAFIEDYNSAYRYTDWESFGSQPDTTVSFMYPKEYGTETFAVHAGDGNDAYTVAAWGGPQEPMDLVAHTPVLTLTPIRYTGEFLGWAVSSNGNDTFSTAHKPVLASPSAKVWVAGVLKTEGIDYAIDYPAGNVTIINDTLWGQVYMDYSVDGSTTLTQGTDYTINQSVLGSDTRYTGFTVVNDNLEGTIIIDYYYAKHWETVEHAAFDQYGTALGPAETLVPPESPLGHTYACFADVTELLSNSGSHDFIGKGQYAVGDVKSTPGVDGSAWETRSFSGWSLIILYESATETAHQFYLYDPIHNASTCPFQKVPYSEDTVFTLKDFYPPEGTVDGRTTYFVGEGDTVYTGDSVGFKGASQPTYTTLSAPPINPANDVMNTKSSTGEMGVDIDTYPILDEVGTDTEANVKLHTEGDRWYLIYIILSFKTNQVPKSDYAFSVASVTYQYELGQ